MNQLASTHVAVRLLGTLGAVANRLDDALEPLGLSLAKYRILTQLTEAGESLPLRLLADHAACVRSNVTQLMDRLEADGLVVRVPDPKDRRSIRAELTPAGRERQVGGRQAVEAAEEEMLAPLSPDEREMLVTLLGRLRT